MLANLARAAARPSLGLVRRAAATTKCPTAATAAAVSVPRNLRCASTLTEVLKAEIAEERLVQFDEGEGFEASQSCLLSMCACCGVVVRFFHLVRLLFWIQSKFLRVVQTSRHCSYIVSTCGESLSCTSVTQPSHEASVTVGSPLRGVVGRFAAVDLPLFRF